MKNALGLVPGRCSVELYRQAAKIQQPVRVLLMKHCCIMWIQVGICMNIHLFIYLKKQTENKYLPSFKRPSCFVILNCLQVVLICAQAYLSVTPWIWLPGQQLFTPKNSDVTTNWHETRKYSTNFQLMRSRLKLRMALRTMFAAQHLLRATLGNLWQSEC